MKHLDVSSVLPISNMTLFVILSLHSDEICTFSLNSQKNFILLGLRIFMKSTLHRLSIGIQKVFWAVIITSFFHWNIMHSCTGKH